MEDIMTLRTRDKIGVVLLVIVSSTAPLCTLLLTEDNVSGAGSSFVDGKTTPGDLYLIENLHNHQNTSSNLESGSIPDKKESTVPNGLSIEKWSSIQSSIKEARYHLNALEPANGYVGTNPAQGWGLLFNTSGVQVTPPDEIKSLCLSLSRFGYEGSTDLVSTSPFITADGNMVEYRYDEDLIEWYINDERGLEQGFTIKAPPSPRMCEKLVLEMSLETSFTPKITPNGEAVIFSDQSSNNVLTYDHLLVIDAKSCIIPSSFYLSSNSPWTITISLDDSKAVYPLTVDPLLTQFISKLTASDGAADDHFGHSVSISGDTIVVGAKYDNVGRNSFQGSAYVFERNQGGADNWGEVVKLTASDGAADDSFGYSVSISGDTIVVGAMYDDVGANTLQGSAYVFRRNQGGGDNWGQVVKLMASDGAVDDYSGYSVSISEDTIVVGAYWDNRGQGSAYVFERNQGGADNWGEVVKLTATDGTADDVFGICVSISGDTIVVGANWDDVGANSRQGSAYVFERNQGGADNWGKIVKLTASDGVAIDWFGSSVSISGDTIVVGAMFDDVGANTDQGSASVFERNLGGADNWGEIGKLTASDGVADDCFGNSVFISGDTIIVGANRDDVDANTDQGSAYVYPLDYVNTPPVITTVDDISAVEDLLYSVDYNATDIDPPGDTLTWSLDTNASWLNINPTTGVLSGTPTNTDVGTFLVNVSVSDGNGGSDYSNFTITVRPDFDGNGKPNDIDKKEEEGSTNLALITGLTFVMLIVIIVIALVVMKKFPIAFFKKKSKSTEKSLEKVKIKKEKRQSRKEKGEKNL